MEDLLSTLLIAGIAGFALIIIGHALNKMKQTAGNKLAWVSLFLVSLVFSWMAYKTYGKWGVVAELGVLSIVNRPIGWLFFAFSSGLTVLISIFSLSYNDKKHSHFSAPFWIILLSAGSMLFFIRDWVGFFIIWEIITWSSFLIIAQGKEKPFKSALYYVVLSLAGSSALFGGMLLVINRTGSFEIAGSISSMLSLWKSDPSLLYLVITLFTITFFTKSAAGPFYMWPAMAHADAPDDFSAFLSGIMVKYGVFGIIIIILPFFSGYAGMTVGDVPLLLFILAVLGAGTAVWGTLMAIRENDMKKLMAHSTVSNIGFIITALVLNTQAGIIAALFHIFNHMLFKGNIFLTLAAVKHRTGERLMHRLGGIGYVMPVTFFAFLLSIISAAAIPPMAGFASKWMIFQSLFTNKVLIFLAIPLFFASTASFMYLYRGLHGIFLGQLPDRFKTIKPAPVFQMIPIIVLMLVIFAVGVFPGLFLIPISTIVSLQMNVDIPINLYSITGATSWINGFAIGAIFVGCFILTIMMYISGKSRKKVEGLDNYMAGETPEEWDMTPEKYHYVYRFYEPWEKMFNPVLESYAASGKWFEYIYFRFKRISVGLKRLFETSQLGLFVGLSIFVIIIIIGIVV
ncbi:MAG: hypothetical protein JXJ04_23600 [Spirochaetales bacterium]|nr:hypothetical protein [Spirochaetales bacterium]